LLILVTGETALRGRLDGLAFILFWLICFGLTFAAIWIAFLDLSAQRRRARDAQRELIESTLREIERSKEQKPRDGAPRQQSG
jgi:hypothetical protein